MVEAIGRAFEAQLLVESEKWAKDAAIKRAEQAELESALLKERAEKAERAMAVSLEKRIDSKKQKKGAVFEQQLLEIRGLERRTRRLRELIPQLRRMTEN